nr:hypothetical protein [Bartonella quintana]
MNSGVDKNNLTKENITTLQKGAANLRGISKTWRTRTTILFVLSLPIILISNAGISTLQKIVATTGHTTIL